MAIASQAANDFLYATSATQFGRLAAVESKVPKFVSGAWTMGDAAAGGDDASVVLGVGIFS